MTKPKPKKTTDKRTRITARLKAALDLMVWGDETGKPLDWDVAAKTANISTRSMRRSLERLPVRQYLNAQKQVIRAALSAKTLSHLGEIAAQRSNMNAAVNACRAIDEADAETPLRSPANAPGVTIRILQVTQAPPAVAHSAALAIDLDPTRASEPTDD
jgi:hypothetical protein